MFLTLDSAERKSDRDPLARALQAFGWVYAPIWLAIFGGTLWALWLVFSGTESPIALEGYSSLGLGALIAALLGAPFLIWGTVLKHQTVTFQKEGHMTDRITSAVEQLGVEKTVDRIGRPVTVRSRDGGKIADGDDRLSRTIVQWHGQKKLLDANEMVVDDDEGDWQVFSETVPNIEVRMGAILSLERIAQDSTRHDKGRDHVRVMEILCAYIRENSNATPPQDHPFGDWEPLKDDATKDERAEHHRKRRERFHGREGGKLRQWARNLPKPRADVAEALKVIGRRTRDQLLVEAAWPNPPTDSTAWPFDDCPHLPDNPGDAPLGRKVLAEFKQKLNVWRGRIEEYPGYRLDLRGTNLQGADLAHGRFQGARFDAARMEGATLTEARMEGAILVEARMEGAILAG
ncbi:MAG: pentapeptide repeat-containing protein, partial [Rhodobacteraceae bacterium]|nr:pentapeptide repeat-containing protein [Paracoccaceae bacterium]